MTTADSPTLTVCAIMKNEAPYLLEWVAFHLLTGATRIRVYDNDSSDGTGEILAALSQSYPVEHIQWATVEGQSPQLAAYNDAANALKGKTDFVALIDADEFLFPSSTNSLPEALATFEPNVGAIALNQRVFGSSGHTDYTPDLVTARFTKRAPISYAENRFFKTIARPECVEAIWNCHNVNLRSGEYVYSNGSPLQRNSEHLGQADDVVTGHFILHHYILKSKGEFEKKRQRGGGMGATLDARLGRYKDDWFFTSRDSKINTEEDRTLAEFRDGLLSKVAELANVCRPCAPENTLQIYDDILRST